MSELNSTEAHAPDDSIYWVISHAPASSVLPERFPIIVDELTRVVCEPALLYLYEKFVKNNSNKIVENTLDASAEDLKEWFRFCEEFGLPWTFASESDITAFNKAMRATISPLTGQRYKTATINRRKTTIRQFYVWARGNKMYRKAPPADSLLDPELDFTAVNARIRKPLKVAADENKEVSVIQATQSQKILKALGPLPSERTAQRDFNQNSAPPVTGEIIPKPKSSRDRIATQVSLETGMRISEVCGLPLKKFARLADPASDTVDVHIKIIGKGNKSRRVDFPGWLILEIKNYIRCESQEILTALNGSNEPQALFINPLSAGTHAGKPLQVRTLQRAFLNACRSAGETKVEKIQKFDSSGVLTVHHVDTPLFNYHDTRHTYAVWTYYTRKKTDPEPWLYIQARLGHVDLKTTLQRYLKLASDFEPDISDRYLKLVKPNA
ncbi:tyrosine-type recombinase/integrase [Massilia aquatica]|uniref:Site-specific integrase n=1 Tax=Massilia aquatica TaxID=2609000 RepID=A0ABX0MFX3_9BURK|nr:site-specific integrase [Massilia aquatica]NHZ42796.1 site-specific integrase [Massilia aquatica]